MTESEVIHNRDKVFTSMSLQSQSHFSTNDSPLIQQNKVQWEIPISLPPQTKKEAVDTGEKSAQEARQASNLPCYYNREYLIPRQPRVSLVTQEQREEGVQRLEFDVEERRGATSDEGMKLQNLFVKKSVSLKREAGKSLKRGILKKHCELLQSEYLFGKEEEAILKNLILILGLNVTDLSEFLIKTSNSVSMDPNALFKVRKNIKTAQDLCEKFHKFRLQCIHGKTNSILPKRTLLKNEDITPPDSQPQTQFEMIKNSKKKTVPCVWFHSPQGCHRGEKCDFIHDQDFRGVPVPHMEKYVRPIHELSRNPEMNKKNLQRYRQNQVDPPAHLKPPHLNVLTPDHPNYPPVPRRESPSHNDGTLAKKFLNN